MRAKDILEIEIGIKNLFVKDTAFEDRKFILRFLNKLDPSLACKGRLFLSGSDIMKLHQIQQVFLDNEAINNQQQSVRKEVEEQEETPSIDRIKKSASSKKRTQKSSGGMGCFASRDEPLQASGPKPEPS